jgi:hypothetical protein
VGKAGLCPIDWKREDVRDVAGSGGQHHQPVDAQRDPGAVGETVLERGQEMFVDRRLGQPGEPSRLDVGFEAPSLLGGVGELVVAVGQFDAFDVDLETFGELRVSGTDAGQSRLVGGPVVDEAGPAVTQMRLERVAEQQIQPSVAIIPDARRGSIPAWRSNASA